MSMETVTNLFTIKFKSHKVVRSLLYVQVVLPISVPTYLKSGFKLPTCHTTTIYFFYDRHACLYKKGGLESNEDHLSYEYPSRIPPFGIIAVFFSGKSRTIINHF